MARLGHTDLGPAGDIYSVLVSELSEEEACFSGAYDIPLSTRCDQRGGALKLSDGQSTDRSWNPTKPQGRRTL